ncbi:hypothetical protein [Anoxybacillus kestanbolensis]|uniref:hypothetical protein n=1 Tax=Anoxybacillus kestanbolensis TaxID=227476 RepID=UPI003D1F9987
MIVPKEDEQTILDVLRSQLEGKMEQNGCKTTVLQPFCQQSETVGQILRFFCLSYFFALCHNK